MITVCLMKKILFCSFGYFHIVCPESLREVDATSVGTADCLSFSELSSVDSVVDDVDVVKFFDFVLDSNLPFDTAPI